MKWTCRNAIHSYVYYTCTSAQQIDKTIENILHCVAYAYVVLSTVLYTGLPCVASFSQTILAHLTNEVCKYFGWEIFSLLMLLYMYRLLISYKDDIVEAHCYVVITSVSILMSKYVEESINQTTDSRTFQPSRPSSTLYETEDAAV